MYFFVEHDALETVDVLTGINRRMNDLTPAFREMGTIVERSVRRNFLESRGPDGIPWAPLKSRPKGRTKPLIKSGTLMNSIRSEADTREVRLETNVVYAAIHQFGGRAGRNNRATIPARPFLGVRDEDWTLIERAVCEHIGQEISSSCTPPLKP